VGLSFCCKIVCMSSSVYKKIIIPTRPQVDTICAIFLLKHFGEKKFPGISKASYVVQSKLSDDQTEDRLDKEGTILIDIGRGRFDHHDKKPQTTVTNLIAEYLGQKDNPALSRLMKFAERDDFYGKGIISTDQIDRSFGLPGLLSSLNKKYKDNPTVVIETILPLIDAYYTEEEKRFFSMPQELEEKVENGKAMKFDVIQRGKKLKCIFIETDDPSMAGFLRSSLGGSFDAVALRLSSGHTNILTIQKKNLDLRALAVLIRLQEAEASGVELSDDPEELSKTGTISQVSEWYYDPTTNSLLNGGPNPQGVKPTRIPSFEMRKILELGLSEELWRPA